MNKLIDVTECEERDLVSDASDEESQCALVHPLHSLVRVVDLHSSHELSHQLGIQVVRACSHGSQTQLVDHLLQIRLEPKYRYSCQVDETCGCDGDFQPLIVEQAVIVVPRISDFTVSAFDVLYSSVRVGIMPKVPRSSPSLSLIQGLLSVSGGGGVVLELLGRSKHLLVLLSLSVICKQRTQEEIAN